MSLVFSILAIPCQAKSTLLFEVDKGKIIYSRNSADVTSIASLTKLVTALVVVQARQNMTQQLVVIGDEKSSRIRPGMKINRMGLLELALISSDNLAANTLLEHYPGGYDKGIRAMNRLVKGIGARSTKLVDATGLSSGNKSTSRDLVKILNETGKYRIFKTLSNSESSFVSITKKNGTRGWTMAHSTNPYVYQEREFEIISAKTGYTRAAGYCIAMMIKYKKKKYIVVTTGNRSKTQRRSQIDNLINLLEKQSNKKKSQKTVSYDSSEDLILISKLPA